MKQSTFVMFKPDAVERKLVGRILSRFEDAGLKIGRLKSVFSLSRDRLEKHYGEHSRQDFFERLIGAMVRRPAILVELWGNDAVRRVRAMIGDTNALEAAPGTIRGDFGRDSGAENLIHASDSAESATREIVLWLGDGWLGDG